MADNNGHLVPVFIIYADGVRLDTEHEGAVKRIRVSDCLDGIGRCVIEFAHPAAALLEKGAIALESAVDVHLGYKDDCAKDFTKCICGCEFCLQNSVSTLCVRQCIIWRATGTFYLSVRSVTGGMFTSGTARCT